MLVEVASRMAPLGPALGDYRYVGMGAIYFVDFMVFHRAFGMTDMVSIEGRPSLVERCAANRPIDCIEVMGREAASVIAELNDGKPTICWMDYDGTLNDDRLDEVTQAIAALAAPSLYVITVHVHPGSEPDRLEEYARRFARRSVPPVDNPAQLNRARYPRLAYSILNTEIQTAVRERHAADPVAWTQIAHFAYEDGAPMLTVAGVLHASDAAIDICGFENLDYSSADDRAFRISVPKLTYRERAQIDRLLPHGDLSDAPGEVAPESIADYAKIYRHLPFFVDAYI